MSDSTLVAYWLKPLQPIILGKKWAKSSKDKVWIIYLFLWNKFFSNYEGVSSHEERPLDLNFSRPPRIVSFIEV